MATTQYPKSSNTFNDWQQLAMVMRPDGVELGGAVTLLGGLGVRLGVTKVFVGGFAGINDANLDFASGAIASANPRYDRLVAELNLPAGTVTFKVIAGPANATPAAPPLTRVPGGKWQYSLARWLVPGSGAGQGVSNTQLVNEGLKPTLNPMIAYGGNPIFDSLAERDAAYIGAGLGAMLPGMHCTVLGVQYVYANGGWGQDLPPYGPVVVANTAAAIPLPEATHFYANDVDKTGVVTSGGPILNLQGIVRQVLKADFNAAGTTLTGSQNIMGQSIDVLQHSLVEYEVGVCIKATGVATGTLTIGMTGAPSRTVTWDSHSLTTLVQKNLSIKVRSPGAGTIAVSLDCVVTSGTGITLHEVPWVIREIT